jgi:Zn-dependent protease with chaperone function
LRAASSRTAEWSTPVRGGLPPVPLVAAAAAVAAAIGAVVARGPAAGIVAAALVGGLALAWERAQGRLALRFFRARRLRAGEHPRVANLLEGVAFDTGIQVPRVYVIDAAGPNALACRAGGPAVALSAPLLESYTRTELEAVIAHCMVRVRDGGTRGAARWCAFGSLGGAGIVAGVAEDAAAAEVTRYPPALASAISKAEPRRGRFSSLFLVADHPSHEARELRLRALAEL